MAYNLLGMFQPQQSQMQTLLGEYYDPKAARMAWLGGALQAAGAGLASGRPGAWAEGLALGGGQGNENYRRRALVEYGIKNQQDQQAKEDQRYNDEWSWRKSQAEEARKRQAKIDARDQYVFDQQIEQDAAADTAWGNIRNMPSTGVPVQNYGLADQYYQMGRVDDAIKTITPQQSESVKPTDDMREYMLAVQQGYTGTFQEYMLGMKKAGAQNINVNGGASETKIWDTAKEQSDAAKAAQRGLSSLSQAQQALPGAITGAGAEQRLALQKVATYFGADPSSVVDTETFRSAIAPQVAAMLKATVGSTQISNADREFAEKAAAGSILLDGQSIQKLINIMQAANSETIRGFNGALDEVYPDGQGFNRERALLQVPQVAKRYAAPIGPNPQSAFPPPDLSGGPGQPNVRKYNPATGRIE